MTDSSQRSNLALMLSGGGARAAYQVGFLRILAREFPGVVPDILTGVSAGGINAAYLAARQEPFGEKVDNLAEIWRNIRIDQVFRVDLRDLASRSVRWGGRLLAGGKYPLRPARSSAVAPANAAKAVAPPTIRSRRFMVWSPFAGNYSVSSPD